MPLPVGTQYRVRSYPSGKRVRLAMLGGRIIETKPMPSIRQTKTKRSLRNRRRRIGLR